MKKIHTAVAGLFAATALAVAAVSYAQPAGGMGPGFGPGMGMGMGHGHGPMGGGDPAAMVDTHLASLKTLLKINTSQEPAWQAFVTAAKAQAAGMQALHAQMQAGTATTAPERMAQHAAAMQQRSAGMATMSTAFSTLYAALTPEQKAIADQHAGQMAQRGMGRGRHAG